MGRAIAALLVFAAACGGGESQTVTLERVAPSVDPTCGAPPDARNITVTARGDFPPFGAAESIFVEPGVVEIDLFPFDTRVLEVRVEGAGGVERTIGRTAELDFDELDDGDTIHVFMAPRRGFCPVDGMASARARPLVARAGDGVLVAGGTDAEGEPATGAERYDPDIGGFVAVSGSFYDDELAGASMTELADGRVAVVGGPETAFQIYDPGADEILPAQFLDGPRAHHAAAALGDGRVLLAGGCAQVTAAGDCDFATALTSTVILDVDSGELEPGPSLAAPRAGGAAILEADGRVLIAGGVNAAGQPVAQAERIDPAGGAGQGIAQVAGRPIPLASGAALAPFADGLPSAEVFAVPPGASTASQVADAPVARAGAAVVGLDDGAVLALGGEGGGDRVEVYAPALERMQSVGAAPFELRDHAAVKLDDGGVLVLGGRDPAGEARAEAWVYRPDLTARFTGTFNTDDPVQSGLLSPSDPGRVLREVSPTRYTVQASGGTGDGPSEWLIAGGPQFVNPTVRLRAGVLAGGLAVLLGFADARNYHYVELFATGPARLWRVRDGARTDTGCDGDPVDAALISAVDSVPTIEVVVDTGALSVTVDGQPVLDCALDEPIPRGLVGAGVLGGAAAIRVNQIQADR